MFRNIWYYCVYRGMLATANKDYKNGQGRQCSQFRSFFFFFSKANHLHIRVIAMDTNFHQCERKPFLYCSFIIAWYLFTIKLKKLKLGLWRKSRGMKRESSAFQEHGKKNVLRFIQKHDDNFFVYKNMSSLHHSNISTSFLKLSIILDSNLILGLPTTESHFKKKIRSWQIT